MFSSLFNVQTEISEAINAPIFLPSAMQKHFFNFRKIASYFSPFQALKGLEYYLKLEKVIQSMFLLLLFFSQMSSPPYEPPRSQEGYPASPPSDPEGQGGRGRGRQGPQGGRKAEASLQEAGVSKTSRWGDTSPVAAVVMSCRQVTDRAERLRIGVSPRKFRQSVVVGIIWVDGHWLSL